MAVSAETRKKLRKRAKSQCECRMRVCTHHRRNGCRCHHGLHSGWEAHHKSRTGGEPQKIVVGAKILFGDGWKYLEDVLTVASAKTRAQALHLYVCHDAYVSTENESGIAVYPRVNSTEANYSSFYMSMIEDIMTKLWNAKCCAPLRADWGQVSNNLIMLDRCWVGVLVLGAWRDICVLSIPVRSTT